MSAPILIVDDNPVNMKLISFLLTKRGFDVHCADGAEAALLELRSFRPALILMDMQMPGMNGFDLTRRIKSDPATAAICIVAVTAYAMKGDEQRVRDAGCDGYLVKPIDTRTLPQVVSSFVANAGGRT
jgi:CheY-like chemotaxis protein